ncbi:hypothetical protein BJ508DRAFT_312799 [Ascobolus immersus RN42]|uniref:Uncharacterized protein n=1 Tax=Ascobolus immersus RN42 TaxID=1160509 RepID=A0A3N4HPS1_ASCIM|nr:hypothetical protein BJ508DRAFT_312799 [Ascobolus immersus RN42]
MPKNNNPAMRVRIPSLSFASDEVLSAISQSASNKANSPFTFRPSKLANSQSAEDDNPEKVLTPITLAHRTNLQRYLVKNQDGESQMVIHTVKHAWSFSDASERDASSQVIADLMGTKHVTGDCVGCGKKYEIKDIWVCVRKGCKRWGCANKKCIETLSKEVDNACEGGKKLCSRWFIPGTELPIGNTR